MASATAARLFALAAVTVGVVLFLRVADAADDGGEVRALLDLGAALDPTGRLLPSWAPGRDPCARDGGFEGVACDARGAVANVSLQGMGLAGTLSPAVAGLRALTGLYLHYNKLRGALPRELAGLTGLTDLYLNVNNFSGPIPPEIGAMASLQGQSFSSRRLPNSLFWPCQPRCVLGLRFLEAIASSSRLLPCGMGAMDSGIEGSDCCIAWTHSISSFCLFWSSLGVSPSRNGPSFTYISRIFFTYIVVRWQRFLADTYHLAYRFALVIASPAAFYLSLFWILFLRRLVLLLC
ncbi:hypothetical protein ABZP36_016187 [Zizania latifolia]